MKAICESLSKAVFLLAMFMSGNAVWAQEQVVMSFASRPMNASSMSVAGIDFMDGLMFSDLTFSAGAGYVFSPDGPFSYVDLDADYRVNDGLSLSLNADYGIGQEYMTYNESGIMTGSFTPGQMLVKLGAGYRISDKYAAYVRLGYLGEKPAADASYGAFAADISFSGKFDVSESASLGAEVGVHDLGTKVTSASGMQFPLPSSAVLNGAYLQKIKDRHRLQVLARFEYYFYGAIAAAVASDFEISQIASIRAGYRYGGKSVIPSFLSLGAGVKFAGARLDLAYLIGAGDSPVGNTLALSVGYSF